jgi:N-acetylneuraminate lyase
MYAALPMPFTAQDAPSEPCLRNVARFGLRQGIEGMYVGGSTGESLTQSVEEGARGYRSLPMKRVARPN